MENAVVYARYSSHNQTEQSIEGQLAAANSYALAHDLNIIHEYCDRAKTGTNDNREEFQQMLSDCAKKQFSVIIVWKVDRFGRNREEITFNKYRCKKHGVRVVYVAENVSEGPEGVILESVLEGMAEYYSLQLSQNVRRGKLESAKKLHVMGGHLPLGYRKGEDGCYEIDPKTAPTVKLIFEKYAEGYTLAALMEYLNAHGHRTAPGKKFTKNSLPRILANEKYIGVYTYKDLIRVENAIPPLVSKEVFRKCQQNMTLHRRTPSADWDYSDYILTGKAYCGICGAKLVGKSGYGRHGRKYNYYVCNHSVCRKGACLKKHIPQPVLDEAVLGSVLDLLKNNELLDYIIDLIWDYYCQNTKEKEEIERLEKRLSSIDSSEQNIIKSIEEGMPFALVKNRLAELTEEKSVARKLLGELKLKAEVGLTKDHIRCFMERFRDANITDRDCMVALVDTLICAIYVEDDSYTIALNYSGEKSVVTFEDIKKASTIDASKSVRPCLQHQGVANSMRTIVYGNTVLISKKLDTQI